MKILSKKKVTIGLATVAVAGIIGGMAASDNLTSKTATDTTPVSTTSSQPTVDSTAQAQALQTAPVTTTAPAAAPAAAATSTKPKKQRTDATAETISGVDKPAVTVVGYSEVPIDATHSDCLYTYSDGTTYQFPWKTIDPQGGTQTNRDGSTTPIATSSETGVCDYRAIGLPKS